MNAADKLVLEGKIHKVLETVKPYLQADGGDIQYIDVTDDFTVLVQLLGACGTCPMSVQTLKFGVEHALLSVIPEIKCVEAVEI